MAGNMAGKMAGKTALEYIFIVYDFMIDFGKDGLTNIIGIFETREEAESTKEFREQTDNEMIEILKMPVGRIYGHEEAIGLAKQNELPKKEYTYVPTLPPGCKFFRSAKHVIRLES